MVLRQVGQVRVIFMRSSSLLYHIEPIHTASLLMLRKKPLEVIERSWPINHFVTILSACAMSDRTARSRPKDPS
jgi:hypothetical protein